jgi:hypothetical protein
LAGEINMSEIIVLLAGIFGIVYSGRLAYWSWFESEYYTKRTQNHKFKKNLWFLPPAITYNFLDKNPVFVIWTMRIASLLMILLCILWVIVGFGGPFVIE